MQQSYRRKGGRIPRNRLLQIRRLAKKEEKRK
jgi:hypothetical protein